MEFIDEVSRRVAFHEAGHAWMMVIEGLSVRSVTVDTGSSAQGDTRGLTISETPMDENNFELARRFARVALTGSLAEHYLMGQWDDEILQARAYDDEKARSALAMSGEELLPEEMDYTIHSISNEVLEQISQLKAWDKITIIAYALMENEILTGDDIFILLGDN